VTERTETEHLPDRGSRLGMRVRPGVLVVYSRGPVPIRAYVIGRAATLGRDPTADIPVDDSGVSRAHVRLELRGSSFWVTDLGSRNGTHVNGELVHAGGAIAEPGSVVRAGRTLLVISADVSPYLAARPSELRGLIGGAALDDARFCIDTIAATKTPVLVLGETGTGKEVVAGLLHERSGRAGPFVALNCAAVPAELVDAELFGHARGAFSGATAARTGLFRAADGGTLFLDEIGEMPPNVQAKLLRSLETEEVRAVGEDRAVRVDVRIVAATNRDVDELVDAGGFRGDLVHRLAGLRIRLPPLRDRREDMPALVEHFANAAGTAVAVLALERLMLHTWPGNVRELRNVIGSAAEIARRKQHQEIELEDVESLLVPPSRPHGTAVDDESALAARVTEALSSAAGDVAAAAERLGMSRSVLYETLRRLRIEPRAFRPRR
jgi:transcriptional regulator with GAF, ATPase, and Fis domain